MPEIVRKDTFWGNVLGGAAAIASIPIGVAKGSYDALNGKSFEAGFEGVVDDVFVSVKEFGDEYAGPITGGVASAVVVTILTVVSGGRHSR